MPSAEGEQSGDHGEKEILQCDARVWKVAYGKMLWKIRSQDKASNNDQDDSEDLHNGDPRLQHTARLYPEVIHQGQYQNNTYCDTFNSSIGHGNEIRNIPRTDDCHRRNDPRMHYPKHGPAP